MHLLGPMGRLLEECLLLLLLWSEPSWPGPRHQLPLPSSREALEERVGPQKPSCWPLRVAVCVYAAPLTAQAITNLSAYSADAAQREPGPANKTTTYSCKHHYRERWRKPMDKTAFDNG